MALTSAEAWTSAHALLCAAAGVGALAVEAWWVAGALGCVFAADLAAVLAPGWPEGMAWQPVGPVALAVAAVMTFRR